MTSDDLDTLYELQEAVATIDCLAFSKLCTDKQDQLLSILARLDPPPEPAAAADADGRVLADAAEYVAAELIGFIDVMQNFKGWAHLYRGSFRYCNDEFPTLHDALERLRELVNPEAPTVAGRVVQQQQSTSPQPPASAHTSSAGARD
jgi:hypothetical protein